MPPDLDCRLAWYPDRGILTMYFQVHGIQAVGANGDNVTLGNVFMATNRRGDSFCYDRIKLERATRFVATEDLEDVALNRHVTSTAHVFSRFAHPGLMGALFYRAVEAEMFVGTGNMALGDVETRVAHEVLAQIRCAVGPHYLLAQRIVDRAVERGATAESLLTAVHSMISGTHGSFAKVMAQRNDERLEREKMQADVQQGNAVFLTMP